MKEVSSNNRKTYLYLVLELPPKRLYIERYRIVLGKSMEVVHTADLIVVIAQHEDNLEVSVAKVYAFTCKYIDSTERVPESIMQIQKYFPKGRLKKGGELVFDALLVHDKEIEEIIRDAKHSLERCKIRTEVQRMQL